MRAAAALGLGITMIALVGYNDQPDLADFFVHMGRNFLLFAIFLAVMK